MTRIRARLAAIAAAALAATALAGCLHDDGGEDPQDVLSETFSNETVAESGLLDLSLDATIEGEQGGTISARVSGPFQGDAENPATFPELDLSAQVSADAVGETLDFEGGIVATAEQAFVEYQGKAYEVPQETFQAFVETFSAQAQASAAAGDEGSADALEQLGIDPSSWLTDLSDEGTEDVEGAETTHISGQVDVAAIVEDIGSLAQTVPGAAEGFDPAQLELVQGFVEDAAIDVYTGTDDRILRRLDVSITLVPPGEVSGVSSVDLALSYVLADVNEPQTIETPGSARPFSQLLDKLNVDLGPLSGSVPGTFDFGGTGGGGGDAYQQYLDCVEQAGDSLEELNACAQQLG